MDLTQLLAENLFSMHAFIAGMTGKPLWALKQEEADQLGQAVQNVARHYDIPGVDQKTVDYIRLIRVLGIVYGMRLLQSDILPDRKPPSPQNAKPVTVSPVATEPNPPAPSEYKPTLRKVSAGHGLPDVEVFM